MPQRQADNKNYLGCEPEVRVNLDLRGSVGSTRQRLNIRLEDVLAESHTDLAEEDKYEEEEESGGHSCMGRECMLKGPGEDSIRN